MFGIGLPEMIVIMAVALIVVGPDKLPDMARSIAKGVLELKKTVSALKSSLTEEGTVISSVQEDLRKTGREVKDQLLDEATRTFKPVLSEFSEAEREADLREVIDVEAGPAREGAPLVQPETAETLPDPGPKEATAPSDRDRDREERA